MFDNLVESQSNAKEARKQASYLGVSAVIYGSLFLALFVWSLYSFDLGGMGGDDPAGSLHSALLKLVF